MASPWHSYLPCAAARTPAAGAASPLRGHALLEALAWLLEFSGVLLNRLGGVFCFIRGLREELKSFKFGAKNNRAIDA